jgi:hypothetical protein
MTGAFSFYWFEYRPGNIRKECAEKATEITKNVLDVDGGAELALPSGDYI